jgi:iron complex outermembrane receptor protein
VDLWLRYVDNLSNLFTATQGLEGINIDDYITLDIRLGWQPLSNLELSLVGANLIDSTRLEFVEELYSFPTQVERRIYGQIKWLF